ncbi:MAG: hypothetical protein H6R03_1823 [Burkholderiaceae bacterium]|nr:hypothetical protein [Burkholderiaceae bacterium]
MSRSASMNTRPSSSVVSQFGSQEWLIQRAALPPTLASITFRWSSRAKKKVWLGSSGSDGGRRSASRQEITSPLYSTIRSPFFNLRPA